MIKTTNAVAVTGLASPVWLPTLHEVSLVAAQMVPIVSLVWLIMQIYRFIRKGGSK